MAVENISTASIRNSNTTAAQNSNEMLITKAKSLGINVNNYYVYSYGVQGNQAEIDYSKLSTAIASKQEEQANSSETADANDSFESTLYGIQSSDNNTDNAKESKKEISSNFDEAINKYSNFYDSKAISNTREGQIAAEWEDITFEANKLTSVTASDTTILEGVKEFITKLTNLVNDTKSFKASDDTEKNKESAVSLNTIRDLMEKENKISVYSENAEETNILGNNPFMKSAFETADYETEEEFAV